MNRRFFILFFILCITLPLHAQESTPDPEAPVTYARLRLGHYAPDAPHVDLIINGSRVFSDVPYPITTNYLTIAAGSLEIEIRAANGDSTLLPLFTIDLLPHHSYTLGIMARPPDENIGRMSDPIQAPLIDETAIIASGAPGTARVIVLNAIAQSTLTTVFGTNQPLSIPFTARGILALPPGDFSLTFSLDSGANLENTISLRSDLLYFIVIYGTSDQPQPSLQVSGTRSIAALIADSVSFTLFNRLIQNSNLVPPLDFDSPFTVFAPTDTAIQTYLSEHNVTFDEILADSTLTTSLVQAHIARGLMFTDTIATLALVPMIDGSDIVIAQDVDGLILDTSGRIVVADVLATNGVIHAVDRVLLTDSEE